jgi:thiol-disulfide isomerase/thioredoxin
MDSWHRALSVAACAWLASTAEAEPPPHEYAPLAYKRIDYQSWTLPDAFSGAPVDLRDIASRAALVLVVYFAPWCENWRYQAPFVAQLHETYNAHGLEVVAISNYGAEVAVRGFFAQDPAPYRVVIESDSRADRAATQHALYRRRTGDERTWGSPYNVLLNARELRAGKVIARKAWVANGELVQEEVEALVRAQLGL